MEGLELINRIEKRIFDHQKENGFETIFDFIGEDLSDLKDKFNNVALADVVKRNWEGLEDDLKLILGRPNFTCGQIARRMREMGYECKEKAEMEQALVIHTMLTHYYKHGKKWRDEFNKYLSA